MANEDRIGRYRVVRRIAESAFVAAPGAVPVAGAGLRLRCEAERQGDGVRRLLYVARVPDEKTRAILSDSFVACLPLKSDHVVPFVDAGSFGENVYGAMALDAGEPLSRLVDPLVGMSGSDARIAERNAILAAIAEAVALGLEAGNAHGGRGLVHDALDLDSIIVDASGRVRVDAAFLDPWIATATIPSSAARFATPKRWTPPAKIATDVHALAALLADLTVGDAQSNLARLLARVAKGEASEAAFVADVRRAADVDLGRRLLGELVSSLEGPASHTQIGVGLAGVAPKKMGPALGHTLPRVEAQRDEDAPPMTARLGSLEAQIDDEESDATIVEPLAAFDVKADDRTPIARVPARQLHARPFGASWTKPPNVLEPSERPEEVPLAKPAAQKPVSRREPRKFASTMIGMDAPDVEKKAPGASPSSGGKLPPIRPAAGAPASPLSGGKPMARADEKTPIAMDIPTAAHSMRGRLLRDLEGDEEEGSTVVAPLWSEAMAKATRDDHSGDSKSRRARYAEQQQGQAPAGTPSRPGAPKVVPIPKMAPVPRASSPGLGSARAPADGARAPSESAPKIGNLPVLWSDEAAPESEEQATIAQPLVPQATPSGPMVSYALESGRFDFDGDKSAHDVTTARGQVHRPDASAAPAPEEASAPPPAAPSVPPQSLPQASVAPAPLARSAEPTPARGTARGAQKLPVGLMIAAFLVAAAIVAIVAIVARSI